MRAFHENIEAADSDGSRGWQRLTGRRPHGPERPVGPRVRPGERGICKCPARPFRSSQRAFLQFGTRAEQLAAGDRSLTRLVRRMARIHRTNAPAASQTGSRGHSETHHQYLPAAGEQSSARIRRVRVHLA